MNNEQVNPTEQQQSSTAAPKSDSELRQAALAAITSAKADIAGGQAPIAPATDTKPPVEPPKPAAAPADTEQQRLAQAYARAERELRASKAALAEHEKVKREHDSLIAKLKDPKARYAAIEEFGGTYDEWTNALIEKKENPKNEAAVRVEAAERRLEQLEERLAAKEKEAQEFQARNQSESARAYAREMVAKNDSYVFTRALGQSDAIVTEYQRRVAERDGSLEETDVAAFVESQIEATIKRQISELVKVDRFNQIMAELGYTQSKPKAPVKEKPTGLNGGTKPPTLTNDMSADGAGEFDFNKATPEQIRARAIKKAEAARIAQRNSG